MDLSHSTIAFAVRHMMISTVRGEFKRFSGAVEFNEADPAISSVEIEIDASSIDTNEPKRDQHLRSPDFLDTERYPTITFKSKRLEMVDARRARIIGDLTVRGVTREVTLDTEYVGMAVSPWGKQAAGFSAQATINRKTFGLSWNQALESGGVLVGEEVKVFIELEIVQEDVLEPEEEAERVAG
jgi:polyisoprenoid-binding protein YceI